MDHLVTIEFHGNAWMRKVLHHELQGRGQGRELCGLWRDEVDPFFSRVDAVTLEQANQVARKYYRTDNLTFVLLGNGSEIRSVAAIYAPKVVERSARQPGWGM